jgi:hypothetical protein
VRRASVRPSQQQHEATHTRHESRVRDSPAQSAARSPGPDPPPLGHHLEQTHSETATLLPLPSPTRARKPLSQGHTSLSARRDDSGRLTLYPTAHARSARWPNGAEPDGASLSAFPPPSPLAALARPGRFSHIVIAGVPVRFPRRPGAHFHADTAGGEGDLCRRDAEGCLPPRPSPPPPARRAAPRASQ